jgi:hypothetical protein
LSSCSHHHGARTSRTRGTGLDTAGGAGPISEGVLEGQQLAARIEAAALRGVDIEVQMFAIAASATHLAVTQSNTISEARSKVDAIHGTAVNSIASTFAAKQYGMTRQ